MMTTAMSVVHRLSPAAGSLLLASVWESLLLLLGARLLLGAMREVSPERRTRVWSAVLVLLLLLPGLTLLAPRHAATAETMHLLPMWSVWLVCVWMGGSALRAGWLAQEAWHAAGVRRRAVTLVVPVELESVLRGERSATLCASAEIDRPCVAGLLRPQILLPVGLVETLSREELRQVLLHEMEHLRRCDDWLNVLQQVSLVLLPLNPALVWLDRHLSRERELACDDGVLRQGGAAKGYAAALVRLAELSMVRRGAAVALSFLGPRGRESELMRRVRRILAGAERSASPRSRWSVPVAAMGASALAVVLALCPQWVRFDRLPTPSGAEMAASTPVPLDHGTGGAMLPAMARMAGARQPRMVPASLRFTPLRVDPPAQRGKRTPRKAERRPVRPEVPAFRTFRTLRSAQVRAVPEPRVVLTGFEVSQAIYAAVPVPGGWLILQL